MMEGTPYQHLPRTKWNCHRESGKRSPEMGEDKSTATLHRTLAVDHHRTWQIPVGR